MKRRWILILLSLGMLFTGCVSKNPGTTTEVPEKEDISGEVLQETDIFSERRLPDADEALKPYLTDNGNSKEMLWGMTDKTIYRFVRLLAEEGWTEGYCLQKLESPYEEWICRTVGIEDWIADEQCYVEKVSLVRDGELRILLSDLERQKFYWTDWTADGPCSTSPQQINGSILNANFLLTDDKTWYIDEEYCSYLYQSSQFLCIDADFTAKEYGNEKMQGIFYQVLPVEDRLYVCGNNLENCFTIWDAKTGEEVFSSNEFGMMHSDGRVVIKSVDEAYLCNPFSFLRFSIKDGTWEKVSAFPGEMNSSTKIYAGEIKEESLFCLALCDGEMVLWEIKKEAASDSGEQIVFAIPYTPSGFLQKTVVDFNKQNADYQVILCFPEAGEDWGQFKTRIFAELAEGEGPDLLDDNLFDVEEGVSKGYLADMTDFCAPYKEEMWDAAWDAGTVSGHKYMIPYSSRLLTLVGSEEWADGQGNFNLEELQTALIETGCKTALAGLSVGEIRAEDAFYYFAVFGKNNADLIDWESKTSYLDGAISLDIMQFVKEHMEPVKREETGAKIAAGEIPLLFADISNINSLQLVTALFQDEEAYVGFPAEETEKNSFLSCTGVMINQRSDKREGAEQFLTYLLSDEVQQSIAEEASQGMTATGLPVNKEAFELFCKYAQEGSDADAYMPQIYTTGGFEYEASAVTEESVKKLKDVFEEAGKVPNTGSVYSILKEELPPYFAGDRAALETGRILQNRVQLYLDELQ